MRKVLLFIAASLMFASCEGLDTNGKSEITRKNEQLTAQIKAIRESLKK